jgi:protein-disulfide isomerase
MHPVMQDVVDKYPGEVNFTRVMVPLRGHPGAEPAALAYLCAPAAGRDALAHALYEADPSQLTPKGVAIMSKELGLDHKALAKCMEAEQTRATLDADMQLFTDAALRGLPSIFVGKRLIGGADEPGVWAAIDAARAGGSSGTDIKWMFALLLVLGLGVSAVSIKAGSSANADETEYA